MYKFAHCRDQKLSSDSVVATTECSLATVQLATFQTDLDLRQAKLGLCTTKDETELLTSYLNSVWPHSVVHVSLLVCPLCCVLALVCIFGVTPQKGTRRCVAGM